MEVMEDIELTCPCCSALLGVDDTGDLFLLEEPPLEPGVSRGIGGLTVVDADPRWREQNYGFNQQGKEPEHLIEFGFPNISAPAPLDPLVEAAADKDLKQKGIK
jgi:hypothetical protein